MAKAYLAVIDHFGLRVIVPEEERRVGAVVAVSRRLGGAVWWAACSDDTAGQLAYLLHDAEFSAALSLLAANSHHFGPVVPLLPAFDSEHTPSQADCRSSARNSMYRWQTVDGVLLNALTSLQFRANYSEIMDGMFACLDDSTTAYAVRRSLLAIDLEDDTHRLSTSSAAAGGAR